MTAQTMLEQVLAAHGLRCTTRQDWLLPDDRAPGILADWCEGHRHALVGSLAIVVRWPDGRELIENFAGVGNGEQGMSDAFGQFISGGLHAMIGALWNVPGGDVVRWCDSLEQEWQAFVGPCCQRGDAFVPPTLETEMQTLLHSESLEQDVHWFRWFACQNDGELTFEALKDNATWNEGLQLLRAQIWPRRDGYYSARQFIMLRRGT